MRSPRRHVITGSIATDHLMTFPGSFTEQLVDGRLHKVSLSFLVDELTIRRGGIAANIAFGVARLGLRPVLVGSVGADFESYRQWLETHQVDTRHVRVSQTLHTARFLCTTDDDNNQIASFYAGAMTEARQIDLRTILQSVSDVELVLICPDDPDAMLRHTRTCRDSSVPFAADPSQQIARMDGKDLSLLFRGARYLFTNEYERGLLIRKTGSSAAEILNSVGAWVTTLGPGGVIVTAADKPPIRVPAAAVRWKLTRPESVTPSGLASSPEPPAGWGTRGQHRWAVSWPRWYWRPPDRRSTASTRMSTLPASPTHTVRPQQPTWPWS